MQWLNQAIEHEKRTASARAALDEAKKVVFHHGWEARPFSFISSKGAYLFGLAVAQGEKDDA